MRRASEADVLDLRRRALEDPHRGRDERPLHRMGEHHVLHGMEDKLGPRDERIAQAGGHFAAVEAAAVAVHHHSKPGPLGKVAMRCISADNILDVLAQPVQRVARVPIER
eukprot:5808173-Prymnesium_polylepis.1